MYSIPVPPAFFHLCMLSALSSIKISEDDKTGLIFCFSLENLKFIFGVEVNKSLFIFLTQIIFPKRDCFLLKGQLEFHSHIVKHNL